MSTTLLSAKYLTKCKIENKFKIDIPAKEK